MNELVTIKQLADVLGTTKSKINYAIKTNGIELTRISNKNYIHRSDVDTITNCITSKIAPKKPPETETANYTPESYNSILGAKEQEIRLLQNTNDLLTEEIRRLTSEIEFKNEQLKEQNQTISDLRSLIMTQKQDRKNLLQRIFRK